MLRAASCRNAVGNRVVGGAKWHAQQTKLNLPMKISLLLAIAAVTALAQTAPPGAPNTGAYRIAGTVVNAVTGEPVRRATVAVLDEKDSQTIASAVSDGNGHFALERLAAAKYQLTASKRGFKTGFYDQHDDFNSAIVTGQDLDTGQLTFRLMPSAMLRGVVTGDGGDPVEGARVLLFLLPRGIGRDFTRARGPENSIEVADTTTTDDTGAYEFGNLNAGEYVLAVTAEPWYALHASANRSRRNSDAGARDMTSSLDMAYPVTYYDSTTDESSATPIALTAGSREEADINLHAVPALHLSVAVPRRQGGGIARPELRQTIFGTQVSAESAGFIDALQTGAVEFTGVAPGHYVLMQGDPPRALDVDATASQQVDSTAGAQTVEVAGTLRSASGQTVQDEANVFLYLMDSPLHLRPLQETVHHGQFRFENVSPGTWELTAWSSSYAMGILSISGNGTTHAGGVFTVGDRALAITATVAKGETRIEGFARKGGEGMAGALVVLVPRNPAAFEGVVRRDQSDSDGSFSLLHVAPGQYTLVAIEGAWDLDRAGPEALASYLPKGVAVTVTGNSGALMRLSEPIVVQPR
ncbi:MAG: carboxypeptidase-like regulatory domain-containing protein [Terracidiphilus sp.]